MGSVLQQLVTVIGVLVGAGATFAATTHVERSKWRRAIDTRWDDKRLAAYSEYAGALKLFLEILFQEAAAKGLPNLTQPLDEPLGPNALAAAESARTVKWEQVLLLGSPQAIDAARLWCKAAQDLSSLVLSDGLDHAEYLRQYRAMDPLRSRFYACARSDLGVPDIDLPSGYGVWQPPRKSRLLSGRSPVHEP